MSAGHWIAEDRGAFERERESQSGAPAAQEYLKPSRFPLVDRLSDEAVVMLAAFRANLPAGKLIE